MARAMVLCAGLGTRLRPLTEELPKPLAPVGDRPILAHIARELGRSGFTEAVINAHHLSEILSQYVESLDLRIKVTYEPEILGTAGGIAAARPLLGPAPVLVHNGDILNVRLPRELIDYGGEGLCLALAPRRRGEGTVGVDRQGHVVRLRDERAGHEARGGDYVGVAALGRGCLDSLPRRGCLIGDWAMPVLRAGGRVDTVWVEGAWTDAGDLSGYLAANLAWLDGHTEGTSGSWLGEGASIGDEVRLDQCVVGPGARIVGRGLLQRCVIWPGARAVAPLSETIVTRCGRYAAGLRRIQLQ
jgi:mannose-1-phosphate guanylyltransferase